MDYSFCLSRNVELPVSIRIASLGGSYDRKQWTNELDISEGSNSDFYVTVQLFGDNKPLTVPVRTSYKAFTNKHSWNEWLTLPLKYCDLPSSAQCAITVWDIVGPRKPVPVGGTTLELFGKHFTLRRGKQKLHIWPGKEADGRVNTTTPSKVKMDDDMEKLEKLVKRYHCGDIRQVEWLDNLAFRRIEQINAKAAEKATEMSLYVDLPKFDFPVVFGEKIYTLPSVGTTTSSPQQPSSQTNAAIANAMNQPMYGETGDQPQSSNSHPTDNPQNYSLVLDLDIVRDNPVEAKHRRLVRSHRNGPLDRDLKPNPKIRDELHNIMSYPPTQTLTTEEKDLVWKFRFYLTRDKRALTKFLKCVVWTDPTEVRQAVDLLPLWVDIDVDDALELLGKEFGNRSVRSYAVNQLRKADDDDLLLYLLQLVQAIKFEHLVEKGPQSYDSSLVQFLIDRAIRNPILGNYFHWYLMVECEDKVVGKMYAKVAYHYFKAILEVPNGHKRRDVLRQQGELVQELYKLAGDIRDVKDVRAKKIDKLRSMIVEPKRALTNIPDLPLPLDPTKTVCAILPAKSSIFNSNLQPLRLMFVCQDQTEYPVIFKAGDDLRQDQLVIQIITLMDKLLRKENLDLKLTPYKVLATGPEHGLVQFVSSKPLAAVLNEYQNSIVEFLKQHHPDDGPDSVSGVDGQVMETYIRSCAGYCVITYLLGVGDRHLDNLLLSPDGYLFHVDFGFILGRDPKPFPPPMKLCKEMIEAMGGANSRHYNKFRQYCYTAFTTLRRNANLILNLFALMVDANIPDIKIEPDKAVVKVQEKFRLDLSEEAAIAYFQGLISESVNALFPQIMETVHKWAQYWRS
ncbi:kinase-like domain-containing protein [Phascolomyces articulosus]|uniref:Phosphatidylinositol 3-kinase VPS34 n=1 Tax=Phascolomyces articulosus TaxID=60185 RepID=A0AAD5PG71_9FUNG|nr:kinase-like domain-containing protein [Phascolomyces articulosus]